jgi:hypothetical protein
MAPNISSFHPLWLIHLFSWRDIAALIGSRAIYGRNASHESDFDYIFPEGTKNAAINVLNKNNVQFTTNNFGTIKIVVEVRDYAIPFCFNIIFLDECNFAAWSKATKLLKVILNEVNINKTDRLKMFNSLVQEFGGAAITNTPSF